METIKVETIKPSPISQNRPQTLQLSVSDYLSTDNYVFACLFYTNKSLIPQDQTTNKLKTSLSKTLTTFYPFAGRIINRVEIDCTDEGVIFAEARFKDCSLSSFLTSPDYEAIQQLLALDIVENVLESVVTWPLLLVKTTYFQCGGFAIGICISHKLADAASLSNFVRSWAAVARGESDAIGYSEFAGTKLYPPANDAFKLPKIQNVNRKSVTKRFVFGGSSSGGPKIEDLRTKAGSSQNGVILRPTRVESVTALIWRCVDAASSSKTTCTKILSQPVNLRPKLPSLLSETLFGNLIYMVLTVSRNGEIEIQETVKEIRARVRELNRLIEEDNESPTNIGPKLLGLGLDNYSKLCQKPHELYSVSSWCRVPFYEGNFGIGDPVWVVGNVAPTISSKTILMDSNDFEGIEAWVTLSEEAMVKFEQNQELLAFASPNPSVVL